MEVKTGIKMKTIRQLRELAGLSKAAAARLLSKSLGRTVPYQTISRFESGESSNPTLEMIQALASAYGVTESQIIDAFRSAAIKKTTPTNKASV